jgi:hypothetical protein
MAPPPGGTKGKPGSLRAKFGAGDAREESRPPPSRLALGPHIGPSPSAGSRCMAATERLSDIYASRTSHIAPGL